LKVKELIKVYFYKFYEIAGKLHDLLLMNTACEILIEKSKKILAVCYVFHIKIKQNNNTFLIQKYI